MIYAGIDVNIINHARALSAGLEAFGLWTWCMCWSQQQAQDGRIPRVAILSALGEKPGVIRRALVRLCASGLLIENDDGSFSLRNYVEKNQTAEEIETRREAGRAANAARQQRARDRRNGGVTPSNAVTVPLLVTPVTGLSLPPQPQPQPPLYLGTASPPAEPVAVKPRRKPETPCPDSQASAAEVTTWADGWKVPAGHPEFANWLDHHRKSDARWRDWAAAWRTWLKNASRFGQQRFANQIVQSGDNRAWKLPENF